MLYLCEDCIDDTYISYDSYADEVCSKCGHPAVYYAIQKDTEIGQLTDKLSDFVYKYYGGQECEDPSYNLILLAEYIINNDDTYKKYKQLKDYIENHNIQYDLAGQDMLDIIKGGE